LGVSLVWLCVAVDIKGTLFTLYSVSTKPTTLQNGKNTHIKYTSLPFSFAKLQPMTNCIGQVANKCISKQIIKAQKTIKRCIKLLKPIFAVI
jgi:hypothetical protein